MFQRGVGYCIIFFIVSFLFLMTFVFAITITPNRASVRQDVVNFIILLLNNTDTGVNITQVNLTLPSTFSFIVDTNGTNQTWGG